MHPSTDRRPRRHTSPPSRPQIAAQPRRHILHFSKMKTNFFVLLNYQSVEKSSFAFYTLQTYNPRPTIRPQPTHGASILIAFLFIDPHHIPFHRSSSAFLFTDPHHIPFLRSLPTIDHSPLSTTSPPGRPFPPAAPPHSSSPRPPLPSHRRSGTQPRHPIAAARPAQWPVARKGQ